jgi:hypothetical protein
VRCGDGQASRELPPLKLFWCDDAPIADIALCPAAHLGCYWPRVTLGFHERLGFHQRREESAKVVDAATIEFVLRHRTDACSARWRTRNQSTARGSPANSNDKVAGQEASGLLGSRRREELSCRGAFND